MFNKLIDTVIVCTAFAVGLLASGGQALADDLIVTKAPAAAWSTPSSACMSVWGFFVTDSPLSWYGVRFYGTIDAGGGYQTHGAPLNPYFAQGSSYLVQKMNREAMWTLAPGALGRPQRLADVQQRHGPCASVDAATHWGASARCSAQRYALGRRLSSGRHRV
jgi:hypothetical protein